MRALWGRGVHGKKHSFGINGGQWLKAGIGTASAIALAVPMAFVLGTATAGATTISTTTIADNGPNPSLTGQTITLVATVTGSDPTGIVTFEAEPASGGVPITNLGTASLTGSSSSNTATLTTSALTATAPGDPWTLYALYGSDSNNSSSNTFSNPPPDQTVIAENITLVDNGPNPSTAGQSVSFTATVNGLDPTGNVDFVATPASGSTPTNPTIDLGTVALTGSTNSNTATLSTSAIPANPPANPWVINATYAGDSNNPTVNTDSSTPLVLQNVSGPATRFTTQGCSIYIVPSGITSVTVLAVGAAGGPGIDGSNSIGGNPGDGDQVNGTVSGLLGGQFLDVCVDYGGGTGGGGHSVTSQIGGNGGDGGGASGVAVGNTFSQPLLVAGGGGGGGGGSLDAGTGGSGGVAGLPTGVNGTNATLGNPGGNGGLSSCSLSSAGPNVGGSGTNNSGPAIAGGGGGGGGGYCGGSGGGNSGNSGSGGGGGGGSDFCSSSSVTGCTVGTGAGTQHVAGPDAGDAAVTISPVGLATPGLTTSATSSITIGATNTISDSATLAGGASPGGSVTFKVFGPSATPVCTGAPVATSSATVTGNGAYNSSAYTPVTAGTYYWVASYSGDSGNAAIANGCGDTGEVSTVNQATTSITTQVAAATVTIGDSISDSATLSGGFNPGQTLTFNAYGPGDPTCSSVTPTFTTTVTVTGNGSYSSTGGATFTPTTAGTYKWIASYVGDTNNKSFTTLCTDANETTVVNPATPTLSTTATGPITVLGAGGGASSVSDSATLASGHNPGGTITFNLYGPESASATPDCSGTSVYTDTVIVTGNGTYSTSVGNNPGGDTPTTAGTYYWVATYSGDTNNNAIGATGACGAAGETSLVNQAGPTISTTATGPIVVGGVDGGAKTLGDSAVLSGGANPGGTITFRAYGPSATASCSGTPAFTSSPVTVTGNGTYNLPSTNLFTPTAAGGYYWVANYSGDTNNVAITGTAACGATGETSVVNKATPVISTVASVGGQLGVHAADTATFTHAYALTGDTVTFNLYGPSPTPSCSLADLVGTTTGTISLSGMSYVATSGFLTPAVTGTYYWIANFAGDANNNNVSGGCGDTNEKVLVTPALQPTGTQLTAPSCTSYAQIFSTGVNGYTYTISSPIPPGLTWSSGPNGALLSGTPTTPGYYSFTVTASTPGQPNVVRTYSLRVALCVDGGTAALTPAIHGHAYSFQLTSAKGTAPYRFVLQSGALPSGMSLSQSGLVSGTTNQTGNFTFTVYVSDSANPVNYGTQTMTINVS